MITKQQAETTVVQLKQRRSELVAKKQDLQTKLGEVNADCSRRLPQHEYFTLQQRRSEMIRSVSECETQFSAINARIADISSTKSKLPDGPEPSKDQTQELVNLRAEYQQFAADKTRVASMRAMAAEFVMKLNPIIRKMIGRIPAHAATSED